MNTVVTWWSDIEAPSHARGLILSISVHALVVVVLGWGIALVMRRYSAGAGHAAWLAVVAALLLLPILQSVVPAIPITLPRGMANPSR